MSGDATLECPGRGADHEQLKTSDMSLLPFQSVDENLRLWGEMQLGSEEGIKCCVRAKVSAHASPPSPLFFVISLLLASSSLQMLYDSDNGAMRDPTTYRCNAIPHARTKDRCAPSRSIPP